MADKGRRGVGLRQSRSQLLLLMLVLLLLVLLNNLVNRLCPQSIRPESRCCRGRHSTGPGLVRRTRLGSRWRRAAVWECRFQYKRLPHVGRECLTHRVNLPLHVRHRPRVHTLLQDPHVSCKVLAGIGVEVGVRRGDCDLSS